LPGQSQIAIFNPRAIGFALFFEKVASGLKKGTEKVVQD